MPCAECWDPARAFFLAAHHQQRQELLVLLQNQVLRAPQHRPELESSPHEESEAQKQSQQKRQTLVERREGTYCARCCDNNYQGVQCEFDRNNRCTPYPVVYSCSLTCGCGISHITSSTGEGEHSRTDSRGLPEVICTARDSAPMAVVVPTEETQGASVGNSIIRLHRKTLRLLRGFSPLAKSIRFTLPVLDLPHACLGLPDVLDAGLLSAVVAAVQREAAAISPRSPKHSHLQQREVEGQHNQRQAERHQHDPVGQGTYMTATCATARVVAEPEPAEDGHVLLPERFQDLLVQESIRRDQQEHSQVPRQQTRFRRLRGGLQEELQQLDFTRNHPSGEFLLDDNGTSSSSDDLACDSEGQPHCYGCSRSDSSSSSKRRPGSSGCWQQMAVQLHSLIFGQDLALQEELLCTAPAAVAPYDKTRSEGPHAMDEANAIGARGAGFQCTSTAAYPVAHSASIMHGTAAAPTVFCDVASFRSPQHIAQSHSHQSLTAEVAQQLLSRVALVALEAHRHPMEHAQYRHANHYKVQLEQAKLQEQNEQQGWGKGSGSRGGCPCTVSSSRSFCMFLLRLLQDYRAQQQGHERLQLLLLQLVLLLVQQQLACHLCRSDERFFEHPALFVVQQLQQLLQRSSWSNDHKGQMLPRLFLVMNSLHQQKRLLLLLQLALLLRTWQVDCRSRHGSGVVRVAYLCILCGGLCYELREAAADILAAGALDELSATFQRTEIEETRASITLMDVTTLDAAKKTVTGASAVVLCASIAKAATKGNRAAAAAATELVASVACCFLLQQRYAKSRLAGATGPCESDFIVRRNIREFAAEVAAPALPLLLLLLLPALHQPLVESTTMHDAAATPFSVSLQAAESLHLVRLALTQAQQTEFNSQASQQRHRQVVVKHQQSQPISQHRQQGSSKDLRQERRQFMRMLEQQLMGLLSTALRRCEERLDVLLPLLRWDCLRSNSILSSKRWTLIEAAAAAVEAPLGYVCVLVRLSRLATTTPAESSGPKEAPLEEVVASLVSMLLSFIHACGAGLIEGAKGASFVEPPAATTLDASLRSAAFGCFSKLLIALTEAARSTCKQIRQAEEAVTTTIISEGAASAASALQGCLARGAVALSRFCLELAAAGRPLPQHEQVSDFLDAAADAESTLLHFSSMHGEVEQQHRHLPPLACELLKLAIESPIVSSKYSSANYSGIRVGKGGDSSICYCAGSCRYGVFTACEASCAQAGEIAKPSTIRDAKGVAPVAGDGAKTAADGRVLAPVPLSYVAVESIVAVALHAFARCLGHQRVSAGAATAEPSSAIYGNYSKRVPEERTIGTGATDFAVRILCTAWAQLIEPVLRQVCCPALSSAVGAATTAAVAGRPAAAAAAKTETARGAAMAALSVTTEQQHALAIIESRGSLVTAFSAAIAAVTAASAQTPRLRGSYSKLQQLQQDFLLLLQDATVAAAHIVLCQEQASSRECCTGSLYEFHGGSYWNAAHRQDPVAVLEQLVQALLSHYDNRAIPVHLLPTKCVSCGISSSCCNSNDETSCLWPLMLQVAAAVPSLRSRALRLFVRLLRRLLAQQRQAEEQQQQQQLVEIWCLLYSFFCTGEAAATVASVERNCGSRSCCCYRMRLSDLLNQDDWVQCSALLLELLELLQQTAREVPCTIAAGASAHSHLAKTAARVNQLAEAEIASRRPPEAEGGCKPIFFASKSHGVCRSTEHPDCIDE